MSRTAANLPDLLQKQDGDPAPTGLNNADDLLAQLAGDEVDRLLSEADAAPVDSAEFDLKETATTASAKPGSVTAATSDPAEASLDELFQELNEEAENKAQAKAATAPVAESVAPVASAVPPAPTASAQPAPTVAKSIESQSTPAAPQPATPDSAADALAAEMEEDEREHAAALRRMKGGGPPVAATPSPAPAVPAPAPAKVPDPDPATAAGLELVAESAVAEKTSGIMIDMSAVEAQDAENASEPILVRVLAWINSPLEGLSYSVRAAIGKVALVTTVNAVGVFLYVLLFRRH